MSSPAPSIFAAPALPEVGQNDFERAARLLHKRAGILLGAHKREMAERTLGMRARHLGMATVHDYLDHLERDANSPHWETFINAFTINHTAFFREQHHFEILAQFLKTRKKPVAVWCCASSTGEEPYSIAITVRENVAAPDSGVYLLATDIDTQAVHRAEEGVYTVDRVKPVSEPLLRKYFMRGTGKRSGMVRVKPVLRDMIEFNTLNLLSPDWPTGHKFDVIFCRNTMIYFDKATQTRLLDRFAKMLKPGGLLFAGHSENFTYLTKAFKLQGQTVYVVKP